MKHQPPLIIRETSPEEQLATKKRDRTRQYRAGALVVAGLTLGLLGFFARWNVLLFLGITMTTLGLLSLAFLSEEARYPDKQNLSDEALGLQVRMDMLFEEARQRREQQLYPSSGVPPESVFAGSDWSADAESASEAAEPGREAAENSGPAEGNGSSAGGV